jgi:hypothetical protein
MKRIFRRWSPISERAIRRCGLTELNCALGDNAHHLFCTRLSVVDISQSKQSISDSGTAFEQLNWISGRRSTVLVADRNFSIRRTREKEER